MADVVIQIEGLDRLLANFRRYGSISSKWINRSIKTSIFDIEAKTKPITPIDTGRLRSSFRQIFGNLRGELKNIAPYSIFVHQGTSRWPLSVPPRNSSTVRQFLLQGTEQTLPTIEQNFKDAGDKIMKDLGNI